MSKGSVILQPATFDDPHAGLLVSKAGGGRVIKRREPWKRSIERRLAVFMQ